jgi:hypothetical protein
VEVSSWLQVDTTSAIEAEENTSNEEAFRGKGNENGKIIKEKN